MFTNQRLDASDFYPRKSTTALQPNRIEPMSMGDVLEGPPAVDLGEAGLPEGARSSHARDSGVLGRLAASGLTERSSDSYA